MKLIWKGLLIYVLFVLLLVSVKADLDPMFYFDNDMFNNFPYGDNSYFYQCSHGQPSNQYPWTSHGCDANYPVGSSLRENNNDRRFRLEKILGFCVLGDDDHGNDCEVGENNDYWASGEFYFFNPEARIMYLQYRVDDELFLIMSDETQTFYNNHYENSNGWQGLSINIPAGWINWHAVLKEWQTGDQDHLQIFPLDASFYETHNSVPYYYKMTAVSSPTNINIVKQKIHLNEGSVASDCKDFIDNDGDWNLDGEFSNDGVAAFDFNEAIYGIDPPQGRGYKILDDDYPQFGELNVDCFDQGCEGQDGPYDFNGNQGKCNYAHEKLMYCNDGYDNDFDGLKDLDDPDCTSFCQGGGLSLSVFSSLGAQYNPEATDGRDACCGDDGFGMCVPDALVNPIPCNYLTQSTCEANLWCKWNPSNFCELKTPAEYCSQFSKTDCPSGACQFQDGDYGYVTPDNKYLCYNNKSNFNGGTTNKWMWIYAPEKPFLITPLNFSGKTVDYISNSEDWYYCDATSQARMGIPIPEYGSFPAPTTGGLTAMNCSAAVETLLSGQGYGEFHNCYINSTPNCCQDTALISLLTAPEDVQKCICTISGHSPLSEFCVEFPEHEFCSQEINMGPEDLLKEYCQHNPRNCFTNPTIRTDRLCEETPNNGERCGSGEVCVDGVVIGVLDGSCCIGPERHCEDVTNIDESLCSSLGGEYYQKSENTACLPTEQDVPIGTTYGCCFGVLVNRNSFFFSSFEELNNESFSCFAYEDNGYFGQCCYDNCDNMKQITPNTIYVDNTRNRIFSLGSVYGYFKTYDIYDADPEVSRIVDILKSDDGTNERIPFELPFLGFAPNLSYYEYLEFDTIYNSPDVGNIYVNDINMGPLKQHISGGDKELVPHHAKVWIRTPELLGQLLSSIEVEVNGETEITIGYDNIFLTAYTPGTQFTSVPQYCAGGFTSWISDLDPPITDPSSNFFMGEDAWMEGYGRYVVTCNQQWPYGWTGHYCCGDDTEINTYGEYFTDTATPAWLVFGGCFNGTPIFNEESVWKKRGFLEYDEFYNSRDELNTYLHSDLIYNGDTFVSCQAPSEKYASLRESYDGTTIGGEIIVGENVDNQCVVVGDYYCINNAWRQYVPGIGQVYDPYNNYYSPSIPSSLELKSVPPATNLIKNSDFGGDCPPTVCEQQGNNAEN